MKVIRPVAIDASNLVSNGAAEPGPGETAWAAGTAYAVGARAYRATTHRIYERLVAGTTALQPELDVAGVAPNWADYGPTNRWAMFDDEVNTQTALASPLIVELAPGLVNSLALLELVGHDVTVTVRDSAGGTVVYTRAVSLEQSSVFDWYTYFFEAFSQRQSVVLTDLPPYLDARITVSITGAGTVKCGQCVVGTIFQIGVTEYGVTAGIKSYSQKKTDLVTGRVSIKKGRLSKRMRGRVTLDTASANVTQLLLQGLESTPVVWLGDESGQLDPLVVWGYYVSFELNVEYATRSFYSLDIEGMI